MPVADIIDGKIVVQTAYHERHLVQQVPGARYDKKSGRWNAPLSWATCVILRGLFGVDEFKTGTDLTAWLWWSYRKWVEPALALRDKVELPAGQQVPYLEEIEEDQKRKLYRYQQVDVAFLVNNRRALLANPPGLGKTGVVLRTMQVLNRLGENPFPALIVCPNSLKLSTWAEEASTWAPELGVQVIDGTATQRRKQLGTEADLYVINWEAVSLHSRIAGFGTIALTDKEKEPKELNEMGLRTVIADEYHKAAEPKTRQTRAVWAVMHDAENRFGMTGTPVKDHIGNLWSLLHGIDPVGFPAKSKYLDRYAQTTFNVYGGLEVHGLNPHTQDEFYRAVDPLIRRVPKKAALPFLPDKLPVQIRHTPMTPKQKKAYVEMRDTMIAQLNDILVAPSPLAKLTRLSQFAAASAELVPTVRRERVGVRQPDGTIIEQMIEMPDADVVLTGPSSKVDDLEDLLEEMGDEPLVVAAVSAQLIELAAERLTKLKIPFGLITGAQSIFERQQAVQQFQAGRLRVIMLTLGAGAEGITLTRANTMLFMQESWSEVQNQQAQDRVHRIGSEIHDFVRIIVQVTPDSVEEHRREVLEAKQIRMEEVVRDRPTLLKLLGVAA